MRLFETIRRKSIISEVKQMGRGTKTTEFLKECLADALIKLMREKDFDKISVKEIADTAGVGRATWFRNFSCKGDALTFKLVRSWNRWADEHELAVRDRFTMKNAADFFRFNFEMRSVIDVIYAVDMRSAVYDAFYQVMMPQCGTSAKECYQRRFYSYGLFGLLDEWVKRGFNETPDEMVKIFYQVMDDRSYI